MILKMALTIKKTNLSQFFIPTNTLGHTLWHAINKHEKKKSIIVKKFKEKKARNNIKLVLPLEEFL